RCKRVSTGYGRRRRSVRVWRWICGVKPTPKAGNKPLPYSIVHGLDKPGVFTTVSFFSLLPARCFILIRYNSKPLYFCCHFYAFVYVEFSRITLEKSGLHIFPCTINCQTRV